MSNKRTPFRRRACPVWGSFHEGMRLPRKEHFLLPLASGMRLRFVLTALLLVLTAVLSFGMTAGEARTTPAGEKTIVGEVEAINLSRSTVSIREYSPGNATKKTQLLQVTLRVDAATVLVKGKDTPISLREMRPSDRVLARYAEGSSGLRALMIRVAGVAAEATPSPAPSP